MDLDIYRKEIDALDILRAEVLRKNPKSTEYLLRIIEDLEIYCDISLVENGGYPQGP